MAEASGNLLLDWLPASARRPCLEAGERIELALGEEILAQGDRANYVYFPGSAVCSLAMGLRSGDKAECAIVGDEGFVGLSLLAGGLRSPVAAIAQIAGHGYRVPLARFSDLVQHQRALRDAVFTYAVFTLNVVGRAVACNSYHSIVERLARWLATMHDRVGRDELPITHDVLSQMLTATRPRISLAAAKLRGMQIIDYQRRAIRILDRKRLEQMSCECYEANYRYRQLLPWANARR